MDLTFAIKYRGTYWARLKSTYNRRGGRVPIAGWRSTDKTAQYANLQGEPSNFDEVLNFSNSDIGEIASKIQGLTNRLKFPKSVIYYIFGYRSYIPVQRPCKFCDLKGQRCDHDPIIAALNFEREEILSNTTDEFFEFDLRRNFNVKISSNYGKYPKVTKDKFTDEFGDNEIRLGLDEHIFNKSVVFPSILLWVCLMGKQTMTF